MESDLYKEIMKWFDEYKKTVIEIMNNPYRIFSAREVCEKFGIAERTLNTWNKKGFPHSKINGKLVYTWCDILDFLEKNKVN